MKQGHVSNQEQETAQSREAGRQAFDRIASVLNFAKLDGASRLEEGKRTWARLITYTDIDPEYWQREAREYDHEVFAAGFFERAQQYWNLETEEYEGLDGSGRQDDSPYNSYAQVVPMSTELFQIVEYWAQFAFSDDWTFFLSGTGGDARDHRLAEFRFKQIGKILGHDRIADRIKRPTSDQAKKTPTLFRIYCTGTKEERELVLQTFWEQGCSEAATEIAVAAALENSKSDMTPVDQLPVAKAEGEKYGEK